MVEVINEISAFIIRYNEELVSGLILLLVIVALILIIVLIHRKPEEVVVKLQKAFADLESKQERLENAIKSEFIINRQESGDNARQVRQELNSSLKSSTESLQQRMLENIRLQKDQLDSFSRQLMAMSRLNEDKLEAMRKTMEFQLQTIQADNTKKLEQMRATVDEKMQSTLEKRLGESFKQVSDRLEQVYKGLGEMRTLATGVGDLKKVLTNVKTRGTWGEIRLGHILEQILTPDQFDVNVATKKNSNERVEFAVKLPGQNDDRDKIVWMPCKMVRYPTV